ncbi:MAG: 5-(carboxyamino)imidazole ribonucleotide synthase [Rhodospirillaceae bacterium]|nr:5-(carboxyamino)imidazole ribonucleotide synthase [Rhodospirillaceae bacterium]
MTADRGQIIPAGSTIGIMGGGQLGRMTAMAAARLGYKVHSFCPEPDSPAFHVSAAKTVASYDDHAALARFADSVDVVTFEFENIPSTAAELLAARKPTRPAPLVLHIAQDRLREKDFLASAKVPTTRYLEVARAEGLERAVRSIGLPCVLKTAQFGYDGKGQVLIGRESDLDEAWRRMGAGIGILEGFVDFTHEVSVIVARGIDGAVAAFPTVENQHRHHILDTTIVPARVPDTVQMRAEAIARHIAEALGLVGLLAVEMFVTPEGEVLVNELAPRPHNSGHWTIDACVTSQFEQFVRAVCGLPLGSVERLADAVMKNLLGDEVAAWREILTEPNAKLHLYGKSEARPGRKMGHVTRVSPKRN